MKANTARCILCALKKRLEALPETLNTPPVVVISAPDDASSHDEGDSIAFTATSTDAESGDISAGIVWTSDVDGSLGTGGTVNISTLSIGTHTITATSTDSGGLVGTDSITITIVEPPPPVPLLFNFDYSDSTALKADGWDFIAQPGNRDTEVDVSIAYNEGGFLRSNHAVGTIYENSNTSVNTIFRDPPPTWHTVTLLLTFSYTDPTVGHGSIGETFLMIYDDDDNYIQIGVLRNVDANTLGIYTIREDGAVYQVTNQDAWTDITDFYLRIEKSGGDFILSHSVDGVNFIALDTITRTFSVERIALYVGKVFGVNNFDSIYKTLEIAYT